MRELWADIATFPPDPQWYAPASRPDDTHARHFDVDIDPAKISRDFPVKQRSRDALLVFGPSEGRTSTRLERVTVIAARAESHKKGYIFVFYQR